MFGKISGIFVRKPIFEASKLLSSSSSSCFEALPRSISTPTMPHSSSSREAGFGSWKSPLTAELVSGSAKKLGQMGMDGEGRLIWLEGRPTEAGRGVLVRAPPYPGSTSLDITPPEFYVRTLVHEYGGGAFTVDGHAIIFSDYRDQRLYKQTLSDFTPLPLTPEYGDQSVRYADGVVDQKLNRYITVREDHRQKDKEAVNEIVAVLLYGDSIKDPEVLVSGNDFYSFPRLNPDCTKLAWIEWGHPYMPWDKAELWVADISTDGKIVNKHCLAGGKESSIEAPTEPRWSPQGELFFVSDKDNGFWNLYQWVEEKNEASPLCSMDAEFTKPAWNFGNSSYDFMEGKSREKNDLIVCTYRKLGRSYVGILYLKSLTLSQLKVPFTEIYGMFTSGDDVFLQAASPTRPLSIVKVHLRENDLGENIYSIIWSSISLDLEKYRPYLSIPEIIEFPTKVPGKNAFANFYMPYNHDYQCQTSERPPLLVRSHGGPTGEARTSMDLTIQYWTSRGWAFADVNYGGSTGYGREYRERLHGSWGVVDVDDCCSCAEFLVSSGKVDNERICIDGQSAGGYTTLSALVFRDTFKAGASLYGIGDLFVLVKDTHKFESHYIDSLIGSDHDVIYNRSPINFIDKLSCPIILFQGLEDKVVPPNQAREIFAAVKEKGIPVTLIEYEGEQHGFRKAENVKYTLEQEMAFFAHTIGGFQVADNIKPAHIENFE